MNIEVSVAKKFQEEALNLLLLEVETMRAQNRGYTTVVFQTGGRGISIEYSAGGCLMGQLQRYPQELWSLLDLALPLVSAMGYHRTGKMLGFYTQPAPHINRWMLDTEPLGEEVLSFFVETLQKIDDAYLSFFNKTLVISTSSLSLVCQLCGASLVRDDGGEHYRCSECGV